MVAKAQILFSSDCAHAGQSMHVHSPGIAASFILSDPQTISHPLRDKGTQKGKGIDRNS